MPRSSRFALLLVGIIGATAACADTGPDAATAGQPVSGGSLTWAVETEPLTFNPHQYAQAKARLLVYNQFETLLTHAPDGSHQPWLATGYDVSADGLSYTLTLRDDVTFHDGEKLTAEVVKANFDKLLEPGYAPAVAAVQLRHLDQVLAVDETTVRLQLARPDVLILDFLTTPQSALISPRSLREATDLKAGGPDVVGTGPFILDRYVAGQEVRYRRNPDYGWAPATAGHQGPAYLETVTYRFLKEPAVRVGALTSGQVQVIEGVPATEQELVGSDPNLVLHRSLNSGSAYSYYLNQSHAPFDDERVRRAFRDAVDVDAVLNAVYQGTATRSWSLVSPSSRFYDASLEGTFGNDPDRANALLDEAGWAQRDAEGFRVKDGQRLTVRLFQSAPFVRDRRDVLAQAVQAAVRQSVGIDLQVRVVDQGTATQAIADNEYEVFENSRADTDAGAALNLLVSSTGSINRTFIDDPEVDQWLTAAQASADQAERTGYYQQVQQRVVTDLALVLPLYGPADQIAAARTVGGLGFEPVAGVPASAYDVWLGG